MEEVVLGRRWSGLDDLKRFLGLLVNTMMVWRLGCVCVSILAGLIALFLTPTEVLVRQHARVAHEEAVLGLLWSDLDAVKLVLGLLINVVMAWQL